MAHPMWSGQLLIGAEVLATVVLILRLARELNVVALVVLPTVAAAMVEVALKDMPIPSFPQRRVGKDRKSRKSDYGVWEGNVANIGMDKCHHVRHHP